MCPGEHVSANGEVLAIVYEGQEVELIAADGKEVFVKGTQTGFRSVGDAHFGNYGPEQEKAYLQLQYGQVLRAIATLESTQ